MLENALLALLTRCLEYYWTEFHQTFSVGAFQDKDERFSVWGQKVKMSRSIYNLLPSLKAVVEDC